MERITTSWLRAAALAWLAASFGLPVYASGFDCQDVLLISWAAFALIWRRRPAPAVVKIVVKVRSTSARPGDAHAVPQG